MKFSRSALLMALTYIASSGGAAPLNGIVQTGGTSAKTPLANVRVTLFEASLGQPTALGQVTTNASGQFVISPPKEASSSIFFVSADIGPGVEFVTVLGSKLPSSVTVNELTTVAASYSLAQFYDTGVVSGSSFALRIAAGINDNIVVPTTGESSPVLSSSPNADQTNSLRSTRALANLLAACIYNPGVTAEFLGLTTPPRGPAPRNTAQALANLARYPARNVESIYLLSKLGSSYLPSLVKVPDAWTVTVKVNDSGNDKFLFGGPGNLVFDSKGYAWITNNVRQGKTTSSRVMMVLQPNGLPSDGTDGTPISPVAGGGTLGVGFGITIDPTGSVWVGNFGWGGVNPSSKHGSVSEFSASGQPISGPRGYQGGPFRAQGMAADAAGNIWITSFGNDSLYVFLGGDPNSTAKFQEYNGSQPFDVAIAPDGTAWVTNSGGLLGFFPCSVAKFALVNGVIQRQFLQFIGNSLKAISVDSEGNAWIAPDGTAWVTNSGGLLGFFPSSVAKFALVNGVIQRQFLQFIGNSLKAISVDSEGNAWIASKGDNSVYGIRPDGTRIGRFSGGGINGPWGVTVDGKDNLWVSNFGPTKTGSNFTSGRLTELCGVNRAARPPGTQVGDPISPETGYTVPSAGSQVLLHNGEPLYGPGSPPSFAPIMRQTNAVIDQAGNIWTINNYKPNFNIDVLSNPGGDGIIIFVGLAAPPAKTH